MPACKTGAHAYQVVVNGSLGEPVHGRVVFFGSCEALLSARAQYGSGDVVDLQLEAPNKATIQCSARVSAPWKPGAVYLLNVVDMADSDAPATPSKG